MSFAIFQQLSQSTATDACLFASILTPTSTDLLLSRGDRLEVHALDGQGRPSLAFACPLFGRPEAVAAFRLAEGPDRVAVLLRNARYLVVFQYAPEFGNFRTLGQQVLAPEDPCLRGAGFEPQLAVDPGHRCIAARVLPDRVLVFPQEPQGSGLGAPFAIGARPLRLHHVQDMAFLHGHHAPTAVCLGQAKPAFGGCLNDANQSTCLVLVFALDLAESTAQLIWAWRRMPHDVFRLVPLLPPLGGMLALCRNAVIYMKEHSRPFCQRLNPCSGIGEELARLGMEVRDETRLELCLENSSVAALSPSALLFSLSPSGRLYLAHLVLESRETVADIVWTSPGTGPRASRLCASGDLVFLAASGGHAILRASATRKRLPGANPAKRRRAETEGRAALLEAHEALQASARSVASYSLAVVDEAHGPGAIRSLAQWEPSRFALCSGLGPRGALEVCQRHVPLEPLAEFDLPESARFSAVWTLPEAAGGDEPLVAEAPLGDVERAAAAERAAAGARHRLALLGGVSRSMLLRVTEEIVEISRATPLDADSATLAFGLLGSFGVQVTPSRLCFLDALQPEGPCCLAAFPLGPLEASGASVCDPYVAVRFGERLRLFALCEGEVRELPLPEQRVVSASLWRDTARTCLAAMTGERGDTLRITDLATMREVFRSERLLELPPVLRNHIGGESGCALDHLRALSDVCAPLPEGARASEAPEASVLCGVELVTVDAEDVGPTLVVLAVGRPVLVYRAFLSRRPGAPFPYHFALVEHDLLGLVSARPSGPFSMVSPLRAPGGAPGGAVVLPPHGGIPAVWLAARRNQLFLHPLPGTQLRSLAQLNAPCCGAGFFALSQGEVVSAQVLALGSVPGAEAFELRCPLPTARKALERTPHLLATHLDSGSLGVTVTETVLEAAEPAGPSVEEDPLGEDTSIVREPPVAVPELPMSRTQPRFELWLDSMGCLGRLGRYRFTFDSGEHVLCLEWISLPGFPEPSLAVGTGANVGEDLTCRGRILIFSTRDREPGILPAIYQRSLKWPVTVIRQWGSYLVHSEGFKLFFERWENSSFNKVAFFDSSMCVTAMSSIKNFLLLGDLRKGLDFVQWKEEGEGQTRSLRRLSRSPPSSLVTVLACDFIVCGKSLGLLALDHVGTAHLYQYTPHSDGREGDQVLRSCATFATGFPCRSALRLQTEPGLQSLLVASGGGELLCFKPIDDQAYRTIATLLGMLATRLPFRGGLNPRAFRHQEGPPALVAPRRSIEDASLLRHFAFVSCHLQSPIAERMRMPAAALLRATLPHASSLLDVPQGPRGAPENSGAAG